SVSRVGGNAQIKAMKKIAGTLKVDQAQYRELEAFSKFGSDLDASTLAVLNKGAKNVEILKQGQYAPVPVENQIAIIYCGTMGLLKDMPVNKVKAFEAEFLEYLSLKHKDVLEDLRKGNINNDITKVLEKAAAEIMIKYRAN
ncbi:MAG: F0F1 ATP synthase subunit alpha, partial [Bacteroidia bacterium]|nr:F0F1 ATP synthase subunit alpha [Bacteroidia bacterium]